MATKPEGKHLQTIMRERQIAKLILKGYGSSDVQEWVREKTDWGVKEAMVEKYIAGAREQICDDAEVDIKKDIASARRRYENLLMMATDMRDNEELDEKTRMDAGKWAQSIQGDLDKLLGLNRQQTKHIEVTTRVPMIDMPPDRVWDEMAKRWAISEYHIRSIDAPQDEGEEDED